MPDIAHWIEEVRTRWWLYVAGYFLVTALIGFVLRFVFRNTNRIVLTVMFAPVTLTWKFIRWATGKRERARG